MESMMETRCINCIKSCNSGCSWSREFEPVHAWCAIKTKQGYCVIDCPEFVQETKENRIKARDIDTNGMLNLLEAFVQQLREDYIHGKDLYSDAIQKNQKGKYKIRVKMTPAEIRATNRKNIEKYLLSKEGQMMLCFTNVNDVIVQLRKLARMYDAQCLRRY